jgi:hypothetical protein
LHTNARPQCAIFIQTLTYIQLTTKSHAFAEHLPMLCSTDRETRDAQITEIDSTQQNINNNNFYEENMLYTIPKGPVF